MTSCRFRWFAKWTEQKRICERSRGGFAAAVCGGTLTLTVIQLANTISCKLSSVSLEIGQ